MLSVNYLLFSVVTVLNKGLSLSLRSIFECVSVRFGSDKHSAYDLYPFNCPLSAVILFKTACFSIIILSYYLSKTLMVIWEFWFSLDSNWL